MSSKEPRLIGSALALVCLSQALISSGISFGTPNAAACAESQKPTGAKPSAQKSTSSKPVPLKPSAAEEPSAAEDSESGSKRLQITRESLLPKTPAKNAPRICWSDPNVKPKVALLCIHGLSLHKGAFDDFGKEISKHGIIAYAIDLRSFGESKTKDYSRLDFDGIMADIHQALVNIRKENPGLPVLILGESMGGAIALRATALYPKLIDGLISSTPARDHYSLADAAPKVISGTLFGGGLSAPIKNLGTVVIEHVSKKEDVKERLKNDPMMRMTFSPSELISFDKYMARNYDIAPMIKDTPVLFIQGVNDKLIKPAGTWKLFDSLGTPNRQIVFSKSTEHLIFEANQFTPEDISFVHNWVNNNIAKLPSKEEAADPLLALLTTPGAKVPIIDTAQSSQSPPTTPQQPAATPKPFTETEDGLTTIAMTPPNVSQTAPTMAPTAIPTVSTPTSSSINYWIELCRNNAFFRCNNKTVFRSGDAIRFHVIPENEGYVYLLITDNVTGTKHVLFPNAKAGTKNDLKGKKDYALPATSWLRFDKQVGTERLSLIFTKEPLEVAPEELHPSLINCSISAEPRNDKVPKEMTVTWKWAQPVQIPNNFSGVSQVSTPRSSLVRLESKNERGMVATEIVLNHR